MKKQAKYYIYRNLHRPGFFSIKYNGIVVNHLDNFLATDIEFRVSKAGLKRARKTKQRNVHAYAVVSNYKPTNKKPRNKRKITYNPFIHDHFVYKDTNEKAEKVQVAFFNKGSVYALSDKYNTARR